MNFKLKYFSYILLFCRYVLSWVTTIIPDNKINVDKNNIPI